MKIHARLPSLEKWVVLGTIVGIVAGLSGVVLSVSIKLIAPIVEKLGGLDHVEGDTVSPTPLLPFLVALGGLISGVLTSRFAPEAEGHGTDSVIEAIHWRGAHIRGRVPLVKLAASSALIGLGGSAGKEGPIALMGAGLGSWLAEKLRLTRAERRTLVLAGVAGGISAVFRAPLGALLFALEVPYKRDMETEIVLPLGIASIVAYVVSIVILGERRLIHIPGVTVHYPIDLLYYAILGVAAGALARLYVKVFYGVRDLFKKSRIPAWLRPAVGGFAAGLIGFLLPHTLGQGYPFLEKAIHGELPLTILAAGIAGKMLTNAFSVGSGGSGGVFAPSLFIGGMLGALFAELYTADPSVVAAFAVVGMASFFAAAGKVPFTSILIVAEITEGYDLIIPSVIAVSLSYVVSGSDSIYESQVDTRSDSPYFLREISTKLLRVMKVGEIMTRDVVTVKPDDTLRKVVELIAETHHTGFPVVDENGRVVGIITQSDVLRYKFNELDKVRVKDAMSKHVIAVLPSSTLEEALHKILRYGIGRLPVVNNYEEMKLVGIVTKKDVVRAYETVRSIL
jgi:CIC family chloride channel protein